MTCQHCQYHKDRAARWRAEAYRLVGHEIELPWVGLTKEDLQEFAKGTPSWEELCYAVEAKLKEKNGVN